MLVNPDDEPPNKLNTEFLWFASFFYYYCFVLFSAFHFAEEFCRIFCALQLQNKCSADVRLVNLCLNGVQSGSVKGGTFVRGEVR